jgi:PAS domain S-box-containing protein
MRQSAAKSDPIEVTGIESSGLELLYRLLDTLPLAAYACDADGLITYFNSKVEALWGTTPLLHNPAHRWCGSYRMYSAVDGTLIPHPECWMAQAILTGEPQVGKEIVVEQPDGTRLTGLAHATPIRDGRGRIIGAINCVIDIADRNRADTAQARLAAIVESSDDAIIGKTLEGKIVSWNTGAQRLFGYTAEEAVGQFVTLIIPAERLDEEREILAKLVKGERVEHYETVRVTKDGRLLDISLTSSPIRDGSGRIIGASKVARDITLRRKQEAQLRTLNEELRAADRAKNDFLATLAHELRNPLAPLRNVVEILHRTEEPSADLRSALGVIDRQTSHMTRLVDDLLDVSRISRNKLQLRKERVDLVQVLETAVEATLPLLSARGHDFGTDLPAEPIPLEADPTRLAQAIANLLNNAAKYTERQGRVRLAARREGGRAVITVRDSGIGIPKGQLSAIFEKFAQLDESLDRAEGGLGIGLHLARHLVELHGGSLSASSDGPGQGSEFTLTVPVAKAPSGPPRIPQAGEAKRGPSFKILVVDDNRDGADSLGLLLELSDHVVRIAYDGLQAVEVAREFQPEVVLLDLGLPKLNGYEAAEHIRELPGCKDITLIALTGLSHETARSLSKGAGFDSHLVKPVDPDALFRVMAALRARAT